MLQEGHQGGSVGQHTHQKVLVLQTNAIWYHAVLQDDHQVVSAGQDTHQVQVLA